MKLIIAGTRYFSNYSLLKDKALDYLTKLEVSPFEKLTIVSGGTSEADYLREKFANEFNYFIEKHNANWNAYGRTASPIRNKETTQLADATICFWDNKSRGTKSMIDEMKKLNKPIKVILY